MPKTNAKPPKRKVSLAKAVTIKRKLLGRIIMHEDAKAGHLLTLPAFSDLIGAPVSKLHARIKEMTHEGMFKSLEVKDVEKDVENLFARNKCADLWTKIPVKYRLLGCHELGRLVQLVRAVQVQQT